MQIIKILMLKIMKKVIFQQEKYFVNGFKYL